MSQRLCAQCGKPLPLQTGKGGRRRYCVTCSPSRRRGPAMAPVRAPVATGEPTPAKTTRRAVKTVTGAVSAELKAAGVLHHWAGQVALVIARRIDADQEPGAALASLVKVLQPVMRTALDSVPVSAEPDPLQQIRARIHAVPDAPKPG